MTNYLKLSQRSEWRKRRKRGNNGKWDKMAEQKDLNVCKKSGEDEGMDKAMWSQV